MTTTRRAFLFGAPLWLARAAENGSERKKILVAIFQRGAMDGLNAVVPFGEQAYYDLRPTLAVPRPGSNDGAIDLNGFFGLHPALKSLKPIYDDRTLAIVHAVGSPDPTRSHFDAQDYMESGAPGRKSTRDGWLNRALPAPGARKPSPVRAVSIGAQLARTLRGRNPATAVSSLADFQIKDQAAAHAFESMYSASADTLLQGTGRDTFEAVKLLESIRKQPYTPASGAEYPGGRFGASMQQIARLIKSDVGLEVAFADFGGWDTHVNEAPQLANLLREFGQGLAAFCRDLGSRMSEIVVVTMSEFGRTARENGNRGTDHGHANAMLVFGGGVRGGQVLGEWPSLAAEQLYEGRDLNLTTDFRDVLGELVSKHLGARDLALVFPGYTGGPARFRGLLA